MAGRGPPPKVTRRPRSKKPTRGAWAAADGIGWQHGKIPTPPAGLMPASKGAWAAWFKSWFAAHWGPEDLPLIRQTIRVFDQVERGEFQRMTELRLWCDTIGASKKGQQDRRWIPPKPEDMPKPERTQPPRRPRHLKVVEL